MADTLFTTQKMTTSALPDDTTIDLATKTPTAILDEALTHLATAIAALRLAGPLYSVHCEPLWDLAAGTWSPLYYQCRIAEAMKKLPKKTCVRQDVQMVVDELQQAVAFLREYGDERGDEDLEDATDQLFRNTGNDL